MYSKASVMQCCGHTFAWPSISPSSPEFLDHLFNTWWASYTNYQVNI